MKIFIEVCERGSSKIINEHNIHEAPRDTKSKFYESEPETTLGDFMEWSSASRDCKPHGKFVEIGLDMKPLDYVAKCNDCGSKDLRASGDDNICNRCGDSAMWPRCSQVVLRLKNNSREDILSALRMWEKQLNTQSKETAKKLIEYVDNAGGEHG